MEKINTKNMDKKIKTVYSIIDENTRQWNIKVKKTPWRGGESRNSYCFDISGLDYENKFETIIHYLKRIFEINNTEESEAFDRAIKQVCSGSGNEAEKITILRSSSLCCLLNFYNVETKPISIDCGNGEIIFNKAFFEVQNPVINTPSNIDVVLISEDCKTVLFLESKYAEYYLDNGPINISTEYLNHEEIGRKFYKSEVLGCFNFLIKGNGEIAKFIDRDEREKFTVDSEKNINGENKSYIGGIKQMVSHYIGINNFLKSKKRVIQNERTDEKLELPSDTKFYLGEIVFDFPAGTEITYYLTDYEEKYEKLKEFLNQNNEIQFLPEILYYSKYKDRLNEVIRKFYWGK